jgi:hypothetical protein
MEIFEQYIVQLVSAGALTQFFARGGHLGGVETGD